MDFPFRKIGEKVVDGKGVECCLYPGVPEILSWLRSKNVQMGIASRVSNVAGAYSLLHLFNLRHYFWPVEIYPTSKTLHFNQIRKKTRIDFAEMVFFDDDKRNLRDLSTLGLPSVHVTKGLKVEHLRAFDDEALLYTGQ